MTIDFKYLPPSPEALSGPAFISQTEQAFNELGQEIDTANTSASEALTTARSALTTATDAALTANDAQTLAQNAQDAAEAAQATADAAGGIADEALDRANAAYDTAANAESKADASGTSAGSAQSAAEAAQQRADAAHTLAENADITATAARNIASTAMGEYVVVPDAIREGDGEPAEPENADEYFQTAQKLYFTGEKLLNFPLQAPFYFDVYITSDGASAFQGAFTDDAIWTRTAALGTVVDEDTGETETVATWTEWTDVVDSFDGNADTAARLATPRAFRVNLASTATANFDGSAACTPGVTGILGTANGGTGNANGTVATLTTARNFSITGGATAAAVSFNGAANVALNVTGLNMGNASAGTLAVARGGTGQTTIQALRNSMGLGNTTGALPIANGGTGATTAAAARTNLGITSTLMAYEIGEFYFFRHGTLRAGFQLAQGGLLANAKTLYPNAWDYLVNGGGKSLCKTEAEWQTLSKATFATVNGTAITWNGIGGVPWFAPNTATGALRLPDIRGMYAEAAGFDSLGVGGVHGDVIRNITAHCNANLVGLDNNITPSTGAFTPSMNNRSNNSSLAWGANKNVVQILFDSSYATPTGNANKPRAFGVLPCVYLDTPK